MLVTHLGRGRDLGSVHTDHQGAGGWVTEHGRGVGREAGGCPGALRLALAIVEAAPGLPGVSLGLVIVTRIHSRARPLTRVCKQENEDLGLH